jgi:pimeloyl-ACP methyl ester carboxylesterase
MNSTNGRTYLKVPAAVLHGFQGLAALWPGQAERVAAWIFCHPHRAALRPREKETLESGTQINFRFGDNDLAAWSWGEGPTVLLHHGWSGRAGQMSAFVDPLVSRGYRVVAYDAPAHGASPGRTTGLPVLAAVLKQFGERNGGIHAVIAHSIGCAATMLAIEKGLCVDRAVLLAPPAEMRVFLSVFAEHLAMSDRLKQGMANRIASWFGIDWAEMDVMHWARRVRPPLLIFHDSNDEAVPWVHGRAVREAWEYAALVTTEGLGHRRIRLDAEVVDRAVAFVERGGEERHDPAEEDSALQSSSTLRHEVSPCAPSLSVP